MHSVAVWNFARSPNYLTNEDKIYPYSEVPFIGQYKLVKLPANNLIELVDYWGEGRIVTGVGTSGFPDSYNVNHQYQLVSNGPDTDRKIPNRIPVISYTNCDTSSYIKDKSVKVVTLMGAPINESCARDIARMVNDDVGRVFIFDFEENSADVRNLDEALKQKAMFYCNGFQKPDKMKELTLFDKQRVYLNITEIKEDCYKKLDAGAYENVVNIFNMLKESNNTSHISDMVSNVLTNKLNNSMNFIHKLWDKGRIQILTDYFPLPFKLTINSENVKILSKRSSQALKIVNVDNEETVIWAEKSDLSSDKIAWNFIPVLIDSNVYFIIKNLKYNLYMKLDDNVDTYGDRKALAINDSHDESIYWKLEPVKLDEEYIFLIVNKKYNQGLKLSMDTEANGDRMLRGDAGSVNINPRYFGWRVLPILS